MTVYFANSGALELDLIRIMGAHVKVNDNPIGHFGTGLKYAIATLVRTGHKITLMINGEQYRFTKREKTIRDKVFEMIYMNDEQLSFTTDLGKNWEPWQAYRELHSNTLDENGSIGESMVVDDTVFIVQGSGIQNAYYDKSNIFLDTRYPDVITPSYNIMLKGSKHCYYRGVRVYDPAKPTMLTYNRLKEGKLTEDRTFASVHDFTYYLINDIATQITNPDVIEMIVTANGNYMESSFDFSMVHGEPSQAFLRAVDNIGLRKCTNESAWRLFMKHSKQETHEPEEVMMTNNEQQIVFDAILLVKKLGVHLKRDEFKIVESLGPNVLARIAGNQVYLAKQTIAMGTGTVAGTLFEEYCHQHLGYIDETRTFQNYLIDKIVELAQR